MPTALNVEYYEQRCSAGLIICEGTAISAQAHGYPNAPGIYTAEQVNGWRAVVDAVHARGGRIVMQVAHNGRNCHSSLMPNSERLVAPSAVPSSIPALTADFEQVQAETPRALETSEIARDFRQAAVNAIAAGFDGIELQGANSHLIAQFLENGTNQLTDAYGGTKENRTRLLFEIVEAVSSAVGLDRLGVHLSPFGQYGGIYDSHPLELFTYVIRELSRRRIGYLHLIEARGSEMGLTDELHEGALNNAALFRPAFHGPLVSAAAYTPARRSETGTPMPSRSGACSSPTRTSCSESGRATHSTIPTVQHSTLADHAGTQTTSRSEATPSAGPIQRKRNQSAFPSARDAV